jgi:zinc transporter, ZIP family
VFAICLHNLPEGLAIGIGFAGTDTAKGLAGHRHHDPGHPGGSGGGRGADGGGLRPRLLGGGGHGLRPVEPVGAAFGASVVVDFPVLLPLGLGFAAGAMLFVVSHEIIPESHRQSHENFATGGLMVGFVMMMMMLDTAFS